MFNIHIQHIHVHCTHTVVVTCKSPKHGRMIHMYMYQYLQPTYFHTPYNLKVETLPKLIYSTLIYTSPTCTCTCTYVLVSQAYVCVHAHYMYMYMHSLHVCTPSFLCTLRRVPSYILFGSCHCNSVVFVCIVHVCTCNHKCTCMLQQHAYESMDCILQVG